MSSTFGQCSILLSILTYFLPHDNQSSNHSPSLHRNSSCSLFNFFSPTHQYYSKCDLYWSTSSALPHILKSLFRICPDIKVASGFLGAIIRWIPKVYQVLQSVAIMLSISIFFFSLITLFCQLFPHIHLLLVLYVVLMNSQHYYYSFIFLNFVLI